MSGSQLRDRLMASWRAASQGAVRVHVILGAPGIGKTTVLRSLEQHIGPAARLVRCEGGALSATLHAAAELARPHRLNRTLEPLRAAASLSKSWSRQSRSAPIAILIDDLHAADPASRTAVGLAVRQYSGGGMLVVMAGRSNSGLTELVDGFDVAELAGLDDDAAAALLHSAAGTTIEGDVARRLVSLAGGNPLALSRLPQTLTPEQLEGREPLPALIPLVGDLRAAFTSPIAELSGSARALLEVIMTSVDGRWPVVAAAAGREVQAVSELERTGVIQLNEGKALPFHPLLRDAVLDTISPDRSRELNTLLAEAPGVAPEVRLVYRARASLAPAPTLVRELEGAADAAVKKRGIDTAVMLLDLAVGLCSDDRKCLELRLRAAELLVLAGGVAGARARLDHVLNVDEGDDALRLRATLLLAALEAVGGNPSQASERLNELAATVDRADLAAVRMAQTIPLGMLGDVAAIIARTDEALAESPTTSLERGAVKVVRAHALCAVDEGAGATLLNEALASLDLRAAVRRDPLFGLHLGRALGLTERYSEGTRMTNLLIAGSRRAGARTTVTMAQGALGEILVRSARWEAALVHLDAAIALSLSAGQRAFAPFWLGLRARVAGYRGDDELARNDLQLGFEISDDMGVAGGRYYLHSHAGVLACAAGRWLESVEHLEQCRHFEREHGGMAPQAARWRLDLIEAYRRLGDHSAAHELARELDAAARIDGASRWTRGVAPLGNALSALQENPARALALAEQSAAILRPDDDRLDRVRARLVQLAAMRAVGVSDEQRRPIAAEVQHSMAALRLTAWSALREEGLGRKPARESDSIAHRLTGAELRVLAEVAQGHGNQQIAARLRISSKTVANHLYRTYAKLGVTSRTEAARLFLLDGSAA